MTAASGAFSKRHNEGGAKNVIWSQIVSESATPLARIARAVSIAVLTGRCRL